jgi:fructosamine-3-kinase
MPIESVLMARLTGILGRQPVGLERLGGGSVGQVFLARMAGSRPVVVKIDESGRPELALEGYMLSYLAAHSRLPVPAVLHCDGSLLVMEYRTGQSIFPALAQIHAAELLADLHQITAPAFGFERDTLIGALPQPNPWTDSWLEFFGQHRLRYMAAEAAEAGRLPSAFLPRLERLCSQLDRWLAEPDQPSLLHGDAWSGNILARAGRITAFLDPAIYYGHPEIELAFTTLFGTFGAPFFRRYEELKPLAPGFMNERKDLYNLYPLLVHVRLFGGGYVGAVDQTLRRFGC